MPINHLVSTMNSAHRSSGPFNSAKAWARRPLSQASIKVLVILCRASAWEMEDVEDRQLFRSWGSEIEVESWDRNLTGLSIKKSKNGSPFLCRKKVAQKSHNEFAPKTLPCQKCGFKTCSKICLQICSSGFICYPAKWCGHGQNRPGTHLLTGNLIHLRTFIHVRTESHKFHPLARRHC